jgi:hypothetical protein
MKNGTSSNRPYALYGIRANRSLRIIRTGLGALEPVVNFTALFAAICLRSLTLAAVISSMYGTKGLSN